MLYGLEKEFFLKDGDEYVIPVPKGLPFDGSGVLVEARGEPRGDITEAVFSLLAEVERLKSSTTLTLDDSPVVTVRKDQKFAVRREYSKEVNSYQNLYGYEYHKTRQNQHTAGVHISFTNPTTIHMENSGTRTVNGMFDFVQLFRHLDSEFNSEIKDAKRRPGFYEIKPDGRVEYRSLPANVDLMKVINVIENFS